jgi:hypothetical protein
MGCFTSVSLLYFVVGQLKTVGKIVVCREPCQKSSQKTHILPMSKKSSQQIHICRRFFGLPRVFLTTLNKPFLCRVQEGSRQTTWGLGKSVISCSAMCCPMKWTNSAIEEFVEGNHFLLHELDLHQIVAELISANYLICSYKACCSPTILPHPQLSPKTSAPFGHTASPPPPTILWHPHSFSSMVTVIWIVHSQQQRTLTPLPPPPPHRMVALSTPTAPSTSRRHGRRRGNGVVE